MSQKIYLAISADKYEYILDFDESAKRLAERLSIDYSTLFGALKSGRVVKCRKCKFEIVKF